MFIKESVDNELLITFAYDMHLFVNVTLLIFIHSSSLIHSLPRRKSLGSCNILQYPSGATLTTPHLDL